MPLILLGCTPTSPVGPLRFQGNVEDQIYGTGWPNTPFILPPASGSTGPLSYTLGPPIPGLSFDAQERTLRGTPTKAGTHHMTYTVSDSRKRTDHLFFTITIGEDAPDGLTSRYRGRGDQVFVLNREGEELDEALYTLDLGDATAGVYVIATNTAGHEVDPTIVRADPRDNTAKGLAAAGLDGRAAEPRPEASARVAERTWITEFNNNAPLSRTRGYSGLRASASARARRGVAEGDRYDFRDWDDNQNLVSIPATARKGGHGRRNDVGVVGGGPGMGAGTGARSVSHVAQHRPLRTRHHATFDAFAGRGSPGSTGLPLRSAATPAIASMRPGTRGRDRLNSAPIAPAC